MCTKFWNTTPQKAFSLIELLVSLIIISVVAAAFAPVMTKRLHRGNILIGTMKNLSITCDNPKCQIVQKTNVYYAKSEQIALTGI